MLRDEIYKLSQKIIKKHKTSDPFEISANSGIMIKHCDNLKKLKGLYTIIKRKRVIIINSSLSDEVRKIVCAHELAHDILHREFAKSKIIHELVLFDMTDKYEYEANLFSANLLISDEEIVELCTDYGYNIKQIAKKLKTDINLVKIKVSDMQKRGYSFNFSEDIKNDFL